MDKDAEFGISTNNLVQKAVTYKENEMGSKYEIQYWNGEKDIHFDYADNFREAIILMNRCKDETKSKAITLIWRED